jgi:hypothetical protein
MVPREQPAVSHPVRDGPSTQARGVELRGRDEPPLPRRHLRNRAVGCVRSRPVVPPRTPIGHDGTPSEPDRPLAVSRATVGQLRTPIQHTAEPCTTEPAADPARRLPEQERHAPVADQASN